MASTISLIDAALEYADKGWPVLPLVPHAKNPLTPKGLLDASATATTIKAWWERWPQANVGLRTGVWFDVLDIDGDVGMASLVEIAGPGWFHDGPASLTGRGQHWLFASGGTANRANMRDKLDWRGTHGYIVAPPSIHPDGHRYRWKDGNNRDAPLPATPDWLAKYMIPWKTRNDRPAKTVLVTEPNPFDPLAKGTTSNAALLRQAATSIVYTAEVMGFAPTKKGRHFVIRCPYHIGDNEASLVLYESDNSFFCFGCEAYGTVLDLQAGTARSKNA